MYAEEAHGWMVQKVVAKNDFPAVTEGQLIDAGASMVGEVIRSNRLDIVQDMSDAQQVRFAAGEPASPEGTFLCVPISSLNRCYGAVTLESRTRSNFSGSEVEVIYRLVENAASLLEVVYTNALIARFVVVDQNTGLMNPRFFLQKLGEEVVRATDLGQDLALVSLAIDGLSDLAIRHGKESPDAILASLGGVLRSSLRPYDVVGRLEPARLGVLLVNTTASDGYLWAERIRKAVAGHVIRIGARSFSVTVSAGVCGLLDGKSSDDLHRGTAEVLGKALEGGGNLVRVY
jgi:diguanylate cyclase (GGDEF)-like protein